MKDNFEKCLEFVLKWEGGFVNDPNDPGGRTIYGISEKAHPEVWAKGVPTKEAAKEIYKKEYWDKIKGDDLPDGLDLAVFDAAVNMGVNRAVRLLQEMANMPPPEIDGIVGDKTLRALRQQLVNAYGILRVQYYERIIKKFPNLARYQKGWFNRVNDLLKE